MDADLVDSALELLDLSGADYVSNVDPPTYPDGLDVEAFTFAALDRAFSEASEVRDREHVTPFLRERKDLFRSTGFRGLADFSALRWTVDHSDDLDHVRRLLACVGAKAPTDFDRFDLYRICERERSRLAQPAHVRNEAMQPALGPGDSS
jgi:spore coat polysaccharide biosynthesis protein SpsF (cytidylyltransferase family)